MNWINLLIKLAFVSHTEKRVYERFRLSHTDYFELKKQASEYEFVPNPFFPELKFEEGLLLKFRINTVTLEFVSGDETDTYIVEFIKIMKPN